MMHAVEKRCSIFLVGKERLIYSADSPTPKGAAQSNGRADRLDLPASDSAIGLFVLGGLSMSGLPSLPPPGNTRYLALAGKKTWAALVKGSSCVSVLAFTNGDIELGPNRRLNSNNFGTRSGDDLEPVLLPAGTAPEMLGKALMDTFAMIRERFVG